MCSVLVTQTASADTSGGNNTNPIKHIVIIMQENHSFDNYFGTFPGVNGIPSDECIPKSLTNPSSGCVKPFLSTTYTDGDLDHTNNASLIAWDNGKMDGFIVAETLNNTMKYYDNQTISYYWNFAKHYTLADNFFSSVLSYTLPNRWYEIAAQAPPMSISNGISLGVGPTILNQFYAQVNSTTTIVDLLNSSGTSWKYYGNPLTVGGYQSAVKAGTTLDLFNPFAAKPSSYTSSYAPHFVNRTKIFTDVKNNALPQVSWVEPTFYTSEHPPYSVKVGMTWTTEVVDAIMNSTSWNSTAIIITYDEYGGYADHVTPPVLDNLGASMRVPAIIISPYAKPGYIDHTTYTFESMLKLIEWRYDLPSLTARDTNANNMLNAFNFTQTSLPPDIIPLSSNDLAILNPIYLTPSTGHVGDAIKFVGNGFDAGQQAKLTFNNTQIAIGNTNATGSYVTTFNVPIMPAGHYVVTDTGPFGDPNRAQFTINSALTISPSNTTTGATITISGTGFAATKPITIKYNGNQVATLTSNKTGTFTTFFVIPSSSSIGSNTVTASDSGGNSASAIVVLPDTIPPTITVPGPITISTLNSTGIGVIYKVSATDPGGSAFTLSCNPTSGSVFPIGNTTVTCTATDSANNSAIASFLVTIKLTPIAITAPSSVVAEATGPLTNITLGAPTVYDSQDPSPTITNNSTSFGFPVGSTIIKWTATDNLSNIATATQNVTIVDTTSPVIISPSQIIKEATAYNGTVVNYNASESDLVDGPGSKFKASLYFSAAIKKPTVQLVKKYLDSTDSIASLGNFTTGFNNFPNQIKIINSPSMKDLGNQINSTLIQTLKPNVMLNYDVENWRFTPSSEQANINGSIYQAANVIHSNGYLAGISPIPQWTNAIYQTFDWNKVDFLILQFQTNATKAADFAKANNQVANFAKSVNPSLQVFAQINIRSTPSTDISAISSLKDFPSIYGISVLWYSDIRDSDLDKVVQYVKRGLVCTPPINSTFPLGNTTVTCSSVDGHGNNSTKTFTVTVHDTTPPTIISPSPVIRGSTGVLTNVTLGKPTVSDISDPSPIVTNNAPATGFPVGTTIVTWTVTDHSGNSATATQSVTILNQSGTILTLKSISNVPWGNTITVSGSLTNSSNGFGLAGKAITFNGTGAINLQPVVTSTNGSFTISGAAPSTVASGWTVQSHFVGNSSNTNSDSAIQTYSTTQHSLTLAVSAKNIPWGQTTSFIATLTDQNNGGMVVSGKLIHFNGTGVIGVTDQTTNGTGKATGTGTAPSTVANGWTYQAHFSGDSLYKKVDSTKSTFNTALHSTMLTLIAPSSVTHGTTYTIGGLLKDGITGSILSSKTITFTASSPIVISNIVTDLAGKYTVSGLTAPSAGSYNIQSHFAGDSLYIRSDSLMKTLTVS